MTLSEDSLTRIRQLALGGLQAQTEGGRRDALERIALVAGLQEHQLPGCEVQAPRAPAATGFDSLDVVLDAGISVQELHAFAQAVPPPGAEQQENP